MSDYQDFLATKQFVVRGQGHEISLEDVNPVLFPFQRMIVKWAVGKGRAAIFAHTGLGKTIMQVEWARLINPHGRTLIIAPLGVTSQTVNEARDLLGLIERCIRLWSNAGEVVFDPFAGIGSTGYEAVKRQREFWGIELKPEYWRVAQNNLKAAENINTYDLFAWADSHAEVVNE